MISSITLKVIIMLNSERRLGPDIIRAIAIILVPTLHTFGYVPTLSNDLLSVKWSMYMALHYLALICVPLFITLTGALNRKKTLSFKYYTGILKVLVPYLFISVVTIVAMYVHTGEFSGIISSVRKILNFSANGYAWYVEMYIGLYLLIPFLNVMYNALGSRKNKLLLLITLIFTTALPYFVKSFAGISLSFDFIPDWWENFYPITYYFLGAYLSEYPPKIKKRYVLCILAASLLVPFAVNYHYTAKYGEHAWFIMNNYGCFSVLAATTCVWILFYEIKKAPKPISAIVKEISVCSFEMYLCSYIVDGCIYAYSNQIGSIAASLKIPMYFSMLFLVLLLSYITARITRLATVPISKGLVSIILKTHRNRTDATHKIADNEGQDTKIE